MHERLSMGRRFVRRVRQVVDCLLFPHYLSMTWAHQGKETPSSFTSGVNRLCWLVAAPVSSPSVRDPPRAEPRLHNSPAGILLGFLYMSSFINSAVNTSRFVVSLYDSVFCLTIILVNSFFFFYKIIRNITFYVGYLSTFSLKHSFWTIFPNYVRSLKANCGLNILTGNMYTKKWFKLGNNFHVTLW